MKQAQDRNVSPSQANEEVNEDGSPKITQYYTEDGDRVEGSTLPPKVTIGEPDVAARPDVHARQVSPEEVDAHSEEELDKRQNREDS